MKILSYQPHQKITYSGGLISLVLLPLFCLWWISKHRYDAKQFGVDIAFFNPVTAKKFPKEYRPYIPQKDYTVINLEGNNRDDSISLKYAGILLNQWKHAKNDSQGIRFHFGKKAKYWTLVEGTEVCKSIGLYSFWPYEDNMYTGWNFPKDKPGIVKRTVPLITCYVERFTTAEDRRAEKIALIKELIKSYWLPGVTFILMAVFTIIKLVTRLYLS